MENILLREKYKNLRKLSILKREKKRQRSPNCLELGNFKALEDMKVDMSEQIPD